MILPEASLAALSRASVPPVTSDICLLTPCPLADASTAPLSTRIADAVISAIYEPTLLPDVLGPSFAMAFPFITISAPSFLPISLAPVSVKSVIRYALDTSILPAATEISTILNPLFINSSFNAVSEAAISNCRPLTSLLPHHPHQNIYS